MMERPGYKDGVPVPVRPDAHRSTTRSCGMKAWEPVANAFSLVSVVVANLLLWAVVFSLILPQAGAR